MLASPVTLPRRCQFCGRTAADRGSAYCDALCAAGWRQVRGQGGGDRRPAMPPDMAQTFAQLLRGEPVDRAASLRFSTWLREPTP